MLIRFYNFEHALHMFHRDGLHFYDIPSLVLAILILVMVIVHIVRSKKRKNDFEKELQDNIEKMQAEDGLEDEEDEYEKYDISELETEPEESIEESLEENVEGE